MVEFGVFVLILFGLGLVVLVLPVLLLVGLLKLLFFIVLIPLKLVAFVFKLAWGAVSAVAGVMLSLLAVIAVALAVAGGLVFLPLLLLVGLGAAIWLLARWIAGVGVPRVAS